MKKVASSSSSSYSSLTSLRNRRLLQDDDTLGEGFQTAASLLQSQLRSSSRKDKEPDEPRIVDDQPSSTSFNKSAQVTSTTLNDEKETEYTKAFTEQDKQIAMQAFELLQRHTSHNPTGYMEVMINRGNTRGKSSEEEWDSSFNAADLVYHLRDVLLLPRELNMVVSMPLILLIFSIHNISFFCVHLVFFHFYI